VVELPNLVIGVHFPAFERIRGPSASPQLLARPEESMSGPGLLVSAGFWIHSISFNAEGE
jgi:hypothetical protein